MFARIYRTSIAAYPFSEKETQIFAIRTIKYFLVWLTVWQDNSVSGSPLQYFEYFGNLNPFHPIELIVAACFLLLIIERIIIDDYTIKRSYFYGPLILIGLALFLSWARGSWIRQEIGIVYEVHESFLAPFEFFIFLNLFRDPHEWRAILLIIITGAIAKGFDGVAVYLFAPVENKSWGTLQLWRDGFLLAISISSVVLSFYYKGTVLKWLKRTMIVTLPVVLLALITSYKRTFFVAILINLLLMFFTVGKGKRLKHLGIFFLLILGIFIVILATDPIGFLTRLFTAVVNPREEGSAYIRLMELPNVLLNIYHNPIFGTAIGTQWFQYIRMPLFANYTTLGTHNSYLYWPLRGGIPLTIGFWWLVTRMGKITFLQFVTAKNPEDKFFAHVSVYIFITYMVSSFFGLMYGDAVNAVLTLQLTSLQLFLREQFGTHSLKNVRFAESIRQKQLVYRYPPTDVIPAA